MMDIELNRSTFLLLELRSWWDKFSVKNIYAQFRKYIHEGYFRFVLYSLQINHIQFMTIQLHSYLMHLYSYLHSHIQSIFALIISNWYPLEYNYCFNVHLNLLCIFVFDFICSVFSGDLCEIFTLLSEIYLNNVKSTQINRFANRKCFHRHKLNEWKFLFATRH